MLYKCLIQPYTFPEDAGCLLVSYTEPHMQKHILIFITTFHKSVDTHDDDDDDEALSLSRCTLLAELPCRKLHIWTNENIS